MDGLQKGSLQEPGLAALVVGPKKEPTTYHVHMSLLTDISPFFAATLKGGFLEARTSTIQLLDDDPDAVKAFVQWLYTGEDDKAYIWWGLHTWIRAWLFRDKIGCPHFQNWAIACFLKFLKVECRIDSGTLRLIYREAPAGSTLRAVAIDQFRWLMSRGSLLRTEDYVSLVAELDDFGADHLRSCLVTRDSGLQNPYECQEKYMLHTGGTQT